MATSKSTQAAALNRTVDFRGFISQLERAIGDDRMDRARVLLREDRFLLCHELSDAHIGGVVLSKADPPRRHACRLDRDGRYMCCTEDLEPCPQQDGKPCEHLLGVILLFVQVGMVDATQLSGWIRRADGKAADLDRDAMTASFARCNET
jgi:hypothetical protein